MKFIYTEDLETELLNKQQKINNLTNELINIFDEVNFEKKVTVNGINFENTYQNIYAGFYANNNLNYKGYVTTDKSNSSNYTVKGDIDNVIEAANNIIDMFYSQIDMDD